MITETTRFGTRTSSPASRAMWRICFPMPTPFDKRCTTMPLLDHFHPPLSKQRHWDSFHGAWAEAIARYLNEDLLPPHFYAEARIKIGTRLEIDVATHEEANGRVKAVDDGGIAVWAPPAPVASA